MNELDATPVFDSMLAHVLPVDQFRRYPNELSLFP